MSRGIGPHRKNAFYILFRIWFMFSIPAAIPAWYTGFEDNMTVACVWWAMIVAVGMAWSLPICSVVMRIAGPIGWADYQAFRDSGGRPVLDGVIPEALSGQSYPVRMGGRPEPWYGLFGPFPDPSWNIQCTECGAMIPTDDFCWRCGATDEVIYEQQEIYQQQPPESTLPEVHHHEGKPYCIDDNGCWYWFYEDGTTYYLEDSKYNRKKRGKRKSCDQTTTPAKWDPPAEEDPDPAIVDMLANRNGQ